MNDICRAARELAEDQLQELSDDKEAMDEFRRFFEDKAAACEYFHNVLASTDRKWLMVIDNFDDSTKFDDNLKAFFPTRGSGRIMVTSRIVNSDLEHLLGNNNVDAEAMAEDQAMELLFKNKRASSRSEVSEGKQILHKLDYLALPVETIGKGRTKGLMQTHDYLEQLRKGISPLEEPTFSGYVPSSSDGIKDRPSDMIRASTKLVCEMHLAPIEKKLKNQETRPEGLALFHLLGMITQVEDYPLRIEMFISYANFAFSKKEVLPWMEFFKLEKDGELEFDEYKFRNCLAELISFNLVKGIQEEVESEKENAEGPSTRLRITMHSTMRMVIKNYIDREKKYADLAELHILSLLFQWLTNGFQGNHRDIEPQADAHIEEATLRTALGGSVDERKSPFSGDWIGGLAQATRRVKETAKREQCDNTYHYASWGERVFYYLQAKESWNLPSWFDGPIMGCLMLFWGNIQMLSNYGPSLLFNEIVLSDRRARQARKSLNS